MLPRGNITTITNNLDATRNKSFGYDDLDRLSTATASGQWGGIGWLYDGVGNRTQQTDGSGTGYYSYFDGTNKLKDITGAGSDSFTYYEDGNTRTDATTGRVYTYNDNQRLTLVVDGSTAKGEYAYNAFGQRVRKKVNGTTITIYHYDLWGQLIAESNSAGTIAAEYVYINGQPLAKLEGANTYYYHNDHLGTPQKMTDASGMVVRAADYKPFGEAAITISTITNNLRFSGQYYDAETALNYNYFRDYKSTVGRYVEADPIGLRGGINLYRYVGNNPNKYSDYNGLLSQEQNDWIDTILGEAVTTTILTSLAGFPITQTALGVGLNVLNVLNPFPPDLNAGEDHEQLMWEIEELGRAVDRLDIDVADTRERLERLIEDEQRRTGLRPCN